MRRENFKGMDAKIHRDRVLLRFNTKYCVREDGGDSCVALCDIFPQGRAIIAKMLRQVFLAACVASAAAFAPAALPTANRRASTVSGEARARPLFPAGAGARSKLRGRRRIACRRNDAAAGALWTVGGDALQGKRRGFRLCAAGPRRGRVAGGPGIVDSVFVPTSQFAGRWPSHQRRSAMQVAGHNTALLERWRDGGSVPRRESRHQLDCMRCCEILEERCFCP
jgi:hypothetical protein